MGWIATFHSRGKSNGSQVPSQTSIISSSYKIPQELFIPFDIRNWSKATSLLSYSSKTTQFANY